MSDGITLTNNGRSWVSVGNPLRHDTVATTAKLEAAQSPARHRVRAGNQAVVAAATVAILVAFTGPSLLLAILCGVLTLPAVWAWRYHAMNSKTAHQPAATAAGLAAHGPRQIMRGDFLPGPRADAADTIVMGSARILQSSSFRNGALGETSVVYSDVVDATWALLQRLKVMERELAEGRRLAATTDDEHTLQELENLNTRADHVWREHIQPLVAAHRELAAAVDDLDRFLDTPRAREPGTALPAAPDFGQQRGAELDALASRVAAAREQALTGRGHPPAVEPGSNTSST